MTRLALVVAATFAGQALAGRPVFRELTLADLTAGAGLVAIAQWVEKPMPPQDGCARFAPRVRLVKVLKAPAVAPGERAAAAGDVLEVLLNATALQDCAYRKDGQRSGVSFSATRVSSALTPATFEKGDTFVVFLDGSGARWRLSVGGAMLSRQHEEAVRAALASGRKGPLPGPPMAPAQAPRGTRYPVPADWPPATVAQFCLKQLPNSTVTGGVSCAGDGVVLERASGDFALQPCEAPTSATAVKWRALYCAVSDTPPPKP